MRPCVVYGLGDTFGDTFFATKRAKKTLCLLTEAGFLTRDDDSVRNALRESNSPFLSRPDSRGPNSRRASNANDTLSGPAA